MRDDPRGLVRGVTGACQQQEDEGRCSDFMQVNISACHTFSQPAVSPSPTSLANLDSLPHGFHVTAVAIESLIGGTAAARSENRGNLTRDGSEATIDLSFLLSIVHCSSMSDFMERCGHAAEN